MAILETRQLQVFFDSKGQSVTHAVRGISYQVEEGETLAIVGESGCGKSTSLMAIVGLLPESSESRGEVLFENKNLLELNQESLNKVRGAQIAMIFQDPMSALNPTMRVGDQISEVLVHHRGLKNSEALPFAVELMNKMGIEDAGIKAKHYPFQFSGGMLQRAAIAMALAGKPKLVLADEPTTALDASIQKQVLTLIKQQQKENNLAMILVTHDLAVVAETADQVLVMYAGKTVEKGSVYQVLTNPQHPYTLGLKKALPDLKQPRDKSLIPIEGLPPDLADEISGCAFADRCNNAMKICAADEPPVSLIKDNSDIASEYRHEVACWLYSEDFLKFGGEG